MLFNLLFFIIIFVLVIGLILISSVLKFIRSIFKPGKRSEQKQNPQQSDDFAQPSRKSKIFEENEGEYVDFEEIK